MSAVETPAVPAVFVPQAISFPETVERLELIKADYLKLKATDLKDKDTEKKIHEAWRHTVDLRLKIEDCRVDAKAPALEHGKRVDAFAKELTATLAPAEEHLRLEDKKFKAEAERIKKEKDEAAKAATQARVDALLAVGDVIPFALAGALEPEAYEARLAASTVAHNDRLAKEAAEEAERQRLIEEARVQREQELERLAEQKAEQEKQAAELKRQQDELAAQQREIAAAQKAESERLAAERKRLEDELAAAAKKVADLKATEERKAESARLKKQAEIDAKLKLEREAAAKAEKERKAEEKRLRKEALRPDREKIEAFAVLIEQLDLPALADEEALAALKIVVAEFAQAVREVANGMDYEGDE